MSALCVILVGTAVACGSFSEVSANVDGIQQKREFTVTVLTREQFDASLRKWDSARSVAPIPGDDGYGNYGDLEFRPGDRSSPSIFSTIETNPIDPYNAQRLRWEGRFPGAIITRVRAYNLGRQRAYVHYIGANANGLVEIFTEVRPNEQCRLYIEVFGRY